MFLNPWYLQQGAQPPPAAADSPNNSSGGSGGSPAPERAMGERMEEGGGSSHSPSPAPSLVSAGSSSSCPPHPSPASAAHVAALQVGKLLSNQFTNLNEKYSMLYQPNVSGGPQAGLDSSCDTGGSPLLLQVGYSHLTRFDREQGTGVVLLNEYELCVVQVFLFIVEDQTM